MPSKKPKNQKSSLKKPTKPDKKSVENLDKKAPKLSRNDKILLFLGLCFLVGSAGITTFVFFTPSEREFVAIFPELPSIKAVDSVNYYSNLTGLKVANEAEITAPAYCIQTPNGMDGARPQAGLNEAGVVFEAIAEAGITRFAAIYQNPTSAIIGPIRSLRLYYLEWDTPFDCTIVHAGGAPDALQVVSRGYKDLTESYTYMYRGSNGIRRWNNLFTTSTYLAKMNADRGYGGSNVQGFRRMTPDESLVSKIDSLAAEKLVIYEPSAGKTSTLVAKTTDIAINFGGIKNFNVRYKYDLNSNTYLRSYESGTEHNIYDCPAGDIGEKNPEDNCTLKQLSPSVVVVMIVQEKKASDNYHENITTIGSGEAYIFQNGTATKGTWNKPSVGEQIKFYNETGAEVALAPGQTFVEAVPQYGSVEY